MLPFGATATATGSPNDPPEVTIDCAPVVGLTRTSAPAPPAALGSATRTSPGWSGPSWGVGVGVGVRFSSADSAPKLGEPRPTWMKSLPPPGTVDRGTIELGGWKALV